MSQNTQVPQFEIPGSRENLEPVRSDQLPRPVHGELPGADLAVHGSAPVQIVQTQPGGTAMTISQPPTLPADDLVVTAEDVDVIEKEWVERAKKILHNFSDDPRTEAIEFAKLKKDYMKRRFNKDLKQAAEEESKQ